MRSPSRPSSAPRSRRRQSRSSTARPVTIEQLERRFAKFRREHAASTRIPDTLRAAVLTAIAQGVTPAELRRRCGLSSGQLARWHGSRDAVSAKVERATPAPRTFSVVGDIPARPAPPSEDAAGEHTCDCMEPIELRLGGWSVSISRVDR